MPVMVALASFAADSDTAFSLVNSEPKAQLARTEWPAFLAVYGWSWFLTGPPEARLSCADLLTLPKCVTPSMKARLARERG